MKYISELTKAKIVIKKLEPLFDSTPDDPYKQLMFAVVKTAIIDLARKYTRNGEIFNDHPLKISARRYLKGDIIHAEICGVQPEYIRYVIKQVGIEL